MRIFGFSEVSKVGHSGKNPAHVVSDDVGYGWTLACTVSRCC